MKLQSPIRVPLVITVFIALTSLLLGWQADRKVSQARSHNEHLRQQLKEQKQNPEEPAPLSKRETLKDRKEDLRRIAQNFISCGIEFKDVYNEYGIRQLDLESRDRIIEAVEGVMTLNQDELKEILVLIKDEADLNYRARQNLLTFILARWGTIDPGKMLTHLAASPDAKQDLRSGYRFVIRATMGTWINKAPDDVLKWLRKAPVTLPQDIVGSAIAYFCGKMSQSEPLKTFDFIAEFSENPHSYFPNILRASKLTATDRARAIKRVNKMAEALDDPAEKQQFIVKNLRAFVLSHNTHEADFQTSIDTIKSANLQIEDYEFIWNPAEADLGYHIKNEQTTDWILWLRDTLPAEKSERRIKQLLKRWEDRDKEAARNFIRNHGLAE